MTATQAEHNLLAKCQEQEAKLMEYEKAYDSLARRANQLECLIGEIALLLRRDMTKET